MYRLSRLLCVCVYVGKCSGQFRTSSPAKPGGVASSCVVFEQLQDVELVVVVLQVGLVQHGVPYLRILTVDMGLCETICKGMQRYPRGY